MTLSGLPALPIVIEQDKEYAAAPTFEIPCINPVTLKLYTLTMETSLNLDSETGVKSLFMTKLILTEDT